MKLIGRLNDFFYKDKEIIVSLKIPIHYLKSVSKLDTERLLDITINDKKSQRTLDQNSKLWALINEIDIHENGSTSEESKMDLYINLIKMSGIQIDYLQGLEVTKTSLEAVYRYVDIIERRITEKGKETCLYACYKGSSRFDKEEMSRFIEKTLYYAESIGLDTTYYIDELTMKYTKVEEIFPGTLESLENLGK